MVKINKYKDSKGKCLFDEYMNKLKKDGCINEFMKIEKAIKEINEYERMIKNEK